MSSESSLVTTAASDTSSSADSRYYSGGAPRPNLQPTTSIPRPWYYSSPPVHSSPSPRRRNYNLKARGVVIAKGATSPSGGANPKVFCVCKSCNGQRMVSKSTCYRHLRVEAEIEEDNVKWDSARWGGHNNVSRQEASRTLHGLGNHLPPIPTGFQLVQ